MKDYEKSADRIAELLRDSKSPGGYSTFRPEIIEALKKELKFFGKMVAKEHGA